jgi:hypothetical protein
LVARASAYPLPQSTVNVLLKFLGKSGKDPLSRPVYYQFHARVGIQDVLPDMTGCTALPSSMEQEIECQRYTIIVNFLLYNKSELE